MPQVFDSADRLPHNVGLTSVNSHLQLRFRLSNLRNPECFGSNRHYEWVGLMIDLTDYCLSLYLIHSPFYSRMGFKSIRCVSPKQDYSGHIWLTRIGRYRPLIGKRLFSFLHMCRIILLSHQLHAPYVSCTKSNKKEPLVPLAHLLVASWPCHPDLLRWIEVSDT